MIHGAGSNSDLRRRTLLLLVVLAGGHLEPAAGQEADGLPPVAAVTAPPENPAAEYVVAGSEAWEVGRRLGFEFYPSIPRSDYLLAGARDGVDTLLKVCASPEQRCRTEARVANGVMIVVAPPCRDCTRAHVFRMFEGRALARGWRIARVELTGGSWSWVRRPAPDASGRGFAVRVLARPGSDAEVRIERLHLNGPGNADWREAFRR